MRQEGKMKESLTDNPPDRPVGDTSIHPTYPSDTATRNNETSKANRFSRPICFTCFSHTLGFFLSLVLMIPLDVVTNSLLVEFTLFLFGFS
jgi:hypothetical protein